MGWYRLLRIREIKGSFLIDLCGLTWPAVCLCLIQALIQPKMRLHWKISMTPSILTLLRKSMLHLVECLPYMTVVTHHRECVCVCV